MIFWIVVIIAVVALGFAVYFNFYYFPACDSLECFHDKLSGCSKTKFMNDGAKGTWLYKIEGRENDKCVVDVEFAQAKVGDEEIARLEGNSMKCYLSLNVVLNPQSDLKKCHGLLKEEMQDLIIKKMHTYLIDNLGKVDEGLLGI